MLTWCEDTNTQIVDLMQALDRVAKQTRSSVMPFVTPKSRLYVQSRHRCMIPLENMNAMGLWWSPERSEAVLSAATPAQVSCLAGNAFTAVQCAAAMFAKDGLLSQLEHVLNGGQLQWPVPPLGPPSRSR